MLEIELKKLVDAEVAEIAKAITSSPERIRITFSITDYYASSFRQEIEIASLKAWFIAETLATLSTFIEYEVKENDDGGADFDFELIPTDSERLAKILVDWAAAFDTDNSSDAAPELVSEAEGWFEERHASQSRFPELEEVFKLNAEASDEEEENESEN